MFGCLPEVVRDRFGIAWSVADQMRFAALATTIAQGSRFVPDRANHWSLRSMLRYVGAQTRDQRYRPPIAA
jgi:uncharacterized protein (DUF2236 family)